MKKILLIVLMATGANTALPARGTIGKGDTVVVPLHGEISPSMFMFLRRAVKTAETNNAGAIVLDMDTHGGRLDTAEDITRMLNQTSIPTYTFINSNAGSAGAIIALATKHIFMSPVSAIGAAAPVQATGEELPAAQRDKTVSYWSAMVRSSAAKNGHNAEIGEAFISKEKEVKIGDRVVHPKGTLLTLNAQEATEIVNGKPLLAEGIADSVDDLARKAKLPGKVSRLEPSGFEHLAFWITSLAPLLLLVGMVCAYLEFKIPGISLPGAIAGVCFALFFLGHYLAGLAGWEVAALFALGVVCVLIEILFFAHSSVIFGVVGVLLMLGSLLWAMIDRYPGQNFLPSGSMLAAPLVNLSIAIAATTVAVMLLAKYLPRTSFYGRFALGTSIPSGPSLTGQQREFASADALPVGTEGIALTTLRPSGKARFDHKIVDVVTDGEFIDANTPVVVVQQDGMRIIVEARTA